MSDDRGSWLQTYLGNQFFPLDPRPEEIHIEDIAHALADQCRFSGHCDVFGYGVGEHSVRVSELAAQLFDPVGRGLGIGMFPEGVRSIALWGLLHDASEAYLVDLPRPIKRNTALGVEYQKIEAYLMQVICDRFGLPREMPAVVHQADDILLVTEARDLMKPPPVPWRETGTKPLDEEIVPWGPEEAEQRFLARYRWCIGEAEASEEIFACDTGARIRQFPPCAGCNGQIKFNEEVSYCDDGRVTCDHCGGHLCNWAPVERREPRVPPQPAGDYLCTGCANVIARGEQVVEVQTKGKPPRTVYAHGKCEALVREIAEQDEEMGYAAAVHAGSRLDSKKARKK